MSTADGGSIRGFTRAWRDVPRLRAEAPGMTAYMRLRGEPGRAPGERPWVAATAISPCALCAVVGAEDPAFFQHRGIWWTGTALRVWSALLGGGRVAGVSTITQQLARNLYLHPGRSAARKLRELALARRLERTLGKARILELYLNVAEWGEGTWGIEAAARRVFDVGAAALDPFQAVVLASLLPAPRVPLAGRNLSRALGSQVRLLHFLYGAGVVTLAEWRETQRRIGALAAGVRAGRSAAEVLRDVGTRPYPASSDGAPPTAAELLASGCGHRPRMAYTAALAPAARPGDVPGGLPPRWTGELPV